MIERRRSLYTTTLITLLAVTFLISAPVITWVPPYNWQACETMLNTDFGGVKMEEGITHLALQFWGPVPETGGIKYVTHEWQTPTDATVQRFKNWAQGKDVKVMLCVYNNDGVWNWNIVKPIIDDSAKRAKHVADLVAEVERLGLDGVEVDYEYPGGTNADHVNFMAFISELSSALRSRGKQLTIATFAYIWNYPNSDGWNELSNYVDGITSMGYEEIGRNASGWASYSSQKSFISTPEKLMLGMPTYAGGLWQGNTVEEQLDWVVQDGIVGVGIWDASLADGAGTANPAWRTATVWNKLKAIKGASSVTQYSITASAGAGGSISPNGTVVVDSGASQSFTITPALGYEVDFVTVNGVSQGAISSYTFHSLSAPATITASFKERPLPKYTVTAEAGSGGSISPAGTVTIDSGSSASFVITPTAGYAIDSVIVNGSDVGRVAQYTLTGIDQNSSIRVAFIPGYTITASAGSGGVISPEGTVSVLSGESHTFTITPNAGAEIADVLVNGESQGAVSSYTFSNIQNSHTISALFTQSFTITASAGNKGTISPSGAVAVAQGGSQSFTITPNSGWGVDYLMVNGVRTPAAMNWTFSDVQADQSLSAYFSKGGLTGSYTITASAGTGGSISPAGTISVSSSETVHYSITAESGYTVADVLVNGESQGTVNSYSFSSIQANQTIEATFAPVAQTWSVTATAEANGSISPAGITTYSEGETRTWTATPHSGYEVDSLFVDGVYKGEISEWTITSIATDHTIRVVFRQITLPEYTITTSTTGDGTISPSGVVTVQHGGTASFTIASASGSSIVDVVVNGSSVGVVTTWTFSNVTENQTIAVTFAVEEIGDGCLDILPWDPTTEWTAYQDGDLRVNDSRKWSVINTAYAIYEPSGEWGHYGWKLEGHCSGSVLPTYSITASANSGGTISPVGATTIDSGSTQSYTITPDEGYLLDSLFINDVVTNPVQTYSFTSVSKDNSIRAVFALKAYSITASSNENGTIAPEGVTTVLHGGSQSYSATPAEGFVLEALYVDGASVGALSSWDFTNVTQNHQIYASFVAPVRYTIMATASEGGTISPLGAVVVDSGANQIFTITPADGFELTELLVNGTSVTVAESYQFTDVAQDATIEARFSAIPIPTYTITATASEGGTISPLGAVVVDSGANQNFTITPADGFELTELLVNGTSVAMAESYQFTDVAQDATIEARFTAIPIPTYTITATASEGGTISPLRAVVVDSGANQIFTITPADGFELTELLVNGTSVAIAESYQFTEVAQDATIEARFAAIPIPTYTITATVSEGGTISPLGETVVDSGANQIFTITPAEGFELTELLVNGTSVAIAESYQFTGVNANATIEARFSAIPIPTYTITATASEGGTISPLGAVVVDSGANQIFTISPAEGFELTELLVNGTSVTVAESYQFTDVAQDATIEARFSAIPIPTYTITATASEGGTISPLGAVVVDSGANQIFTITPAEGFELTELLVNGTSVAMAESYQFTDVAQDATIEARFDKAVAITRQEMSTTNRGMMVSPSLIASGEPVKLTIVLGNESLPSRGEWECALFDHVGNRIFETTPRSYSGGPITVDLPTFSHRTSGSFLLVVKTNFQNKITVYKTILGVKRW